jgi:hypothetical protein
VAYDADLAERVREVLGSEPVQEKAMFGGLAFLVGGHMSVAVSGRGGLLVRHDPADTERLLEEPGAGEMEMGNRGPMRGWLVVSPDALADDAALRSWVARGLGYAKSLPAKG